MIVECPRCRSKNIEPCFREGYDWVCNDCTMMFDCSYAKGGYDHLHSNDPKDTMFHDDNVNHPNHYTQGGIETIDYMESINTQEEFKGFCKNNAIKYLSREANKNGLEDIKKARWYLNKLIEVLEE